MTCRTLFREKEDTKEPILNYLIQMNLKKMPKLIYGDRNKNIHCLESFTVAAGRKGHKMKC